MDKLHKDFIGIEQANSEIIYIAFSNISHVVIKAGANIENQIFLKTQLEPIKTKLDFKALRKLFEQQ